MTCPLFWFVDDLGESLMNCAPTTWAEHVVGSGCQQRVSELNPPLCYIKNVCVHGRIENRRIRVDCTRDEWDCRT
jgi:hypothetical protein